MESIIEWKFSTNKNRSEYWYFIAIAIVWGISVWGVLTKQYMLSVIMILLTWIYLYVENNSNEDIDVFVNELWISVDGKFYDFAQINSFGIIYSENEAVMIRLSLKKKGLKVLDLKLDNEIALELKNFLPNYVLEDEDTDLSFSEKLINFLKL